LKAKGWQFFERPAGDEVITRGFISGKVSNFLLDFGTFEVGGGGFELERDVRVASEFELGSGVGLEYRGKLLGEGLRFFCIGSCPCSM
jgi:hypothetical protein